MQKSFHEESQSNLQNYFDLLVKQISTAAYKIVIQQLEADIDLQGKLQGNSEDVDLISVDQVLHLTNPPISRTNLYYWTKAGKVQAFYVGTRVFYSKKAVLSFLTSVIKKPPKR